MSAALALESERGWQLRPLGELLAVQNGFAFSSKKFSETNGVPLIRIRDLKNDGVSAVKFDGEFDPSYLVDDGDLLIGMDGEFVCYEWAGGPALLNQRVCRLTDFSSDLEPRFVLYGINKFLREIEDATTFTTVKHLSSKKIKAIQFPLPPVDEQKRIVAVLDQAFAALDRARANAEANVADAEELLEVQREKLLSEKGADWTETTVGKICDGFEYGTSSKSHPNGKIPVLRMGNLQDGEIDWSDLKYTDDQQDIQKYLLRDGDVLFNRTNSIEHVGKSAIYRGERTAIFAGYLIRVKYNPKIVYPEFLNIYLGSRRAKEYGHSVMGKSVNQANISASKLKTYPLTLPSLAEQKEIAAKTEGLSERVGVAIEHLNSKLANIADLRQSILQKAFAGELT